MSREDPVAQLRRAVGAYDENRTMCNKLSHVRRIDETDIATLERLITERLGIVKLLSELKVPSGAFDHGYKHIDIVAVLRQKCGLRAYPARHEDCAASPEIAAACPTCREP